MRVFAEDAWGIFKENVIGTAAEYSYADGKIVRGEHAVGGLDVRAGRPKHIFAATGRLPAFAAGNADVDIEMLEAARFSMLVNHHDEEREFAYTSGAEASLTKAHQLGWIVVSMKNDWTTVFRERRRRPRRAQVLGALGSAIETHGKGLELAREL